MASRSPRWSARSSSRLFSAEPSSSAVDSRTVANRQCSSSSSPRKVPKCVWVLPTSTASSTARLSPPLVDCRGLDERRPDPADRLALPERPRARRRARRPSGVRRPGSSSSSGTSTKRRRHDLGVGQPQALRLVDEVAEQQHVDVDRARAVARPARAPAELALDRLAGVQQPLGPELRSARDARVEEVGLVGDLADRLGLVDRRRASTSTCCAGSAATAASSFARRSPTFEPEPEVAERDASRYSSSSRQTSTETSSTGSGDRRLGLGRLDPHALDLEVGQQAVGDRRAQPLERAVGALLGDERDGLADLRVVDGVLDAVGDRRVGLADVEAQVEDAGAGRPRARPR